MLKHASLDTGLQCATTRLGAFGLRPEQAGEIAAKALVSSSMKGNPVALSPADLEAALLQAL